MTNERKEELQRQCSKFRNDLIDLLHSIQTGHPGGSLSCTEILTSLYFEIMNVNPEDPEMEGRDHLILSKGHAAPMLYLVLAEKGFFPKEELKTLRQMDSMLQGHPCVHKTPGVELSTGPLGLGLSAGLGMAMADRIKGLDAYRLRRAVSGRLPCPPPNSGLTISSAFWTTTEYSWTALWRKSCPWETSGQNGRLLGGM